MHSWSRATPTLFQPGGASCGLGSQVSAPRGTVRLPPVWLDAWRLCAASTLGSTPRGTSSRTPPPPCGRREFPVRCLGFWRFPRPRRWWRVRPRVVCWSFETGPCWSFCTGRGCGCRRLWPSTGRMFRSTNVWCGSGRAKGARAGLCRLGRLLPRPSTPCCATCRPKAPMGRGLCFGTTGAGDSPAAPHDASPPMPAGRPGWRRCIPMHSGTPAPRTCCRRVPISGPFRNSLGTRVWPQQNATLTSTLHTCFGCIDRPIPERVVPTRRRGTPTTDLGFGPPSLSGRMFRRRAFPVSELPGRWCVLRQQCAERS